MTKTRRARSRATAVQSTVEALTHANIESILRIEDKARETKPRLYRAVARVAGFCGTVTFLWCNFAVFFAWIAFNVTPAAFDPYPFTFLILVVSLEAIFLAILILISQNMTAEQNERRHQLDLQIDLLNEREMTALLRLLTRMAAHAGMDDKAIEEARELAEETDPAAVLNEIVKAELQHERLNGRQRRRRDGAT